MRLAHVLTFISDAMKLIGLHPPNYICFRCRIPGHHIKNCLSNAVTGLWEITAAVNLSSFLRQSFRDWMSFMNSQDKNHAPLKRMRKCAGIPRSFLVEVDDPDRKGVMMDSSGKYVIPVMDAWVYCTWSCLVLESFAWIMLCLNCLAMPMPLGRKRSRPSHPRMSLHPLPHPHPIWFLPRCCVWSVRICWRMPWWFPAAGAAPVMNVSVWSN